MLKVFIFISLVFILSVYARALNVDTTCNISKKIPVGSVCQYFYDMNFDKVISMLNTKEKTAEAMYYLGVSYIYANNDLKNDTKALTLLKKSASLNFTPAKRYLAWLYETGYIVQQNLDIAEEMYIGLGARASIEEISDIRYNHYEFQPYKSYMNTVRFLQFSIKNDIIKTQLYLDDVLEYRSRAMQNNSSLHTDHIHGIYNRIFNTKYKEEVLKHWRKNHMFNVNLFRTGLGPMLDIPILVLGEHELLKGAIYNPVVVEDYHFSKIITVSFNQDGKPYFIWNDFMTQPSFDCDKASLLTERTICKSMELSSLDVNLSNIYYKAKIFLTNKSYLQLKSDQIKFLKKRNNCKKDKECIALSMKDRITNLKTLIDEEYYKDILDNKKSEKIIGKWKNTYEYIAAPNCLPGDEYETLVELADSFDEISINATSVDFIGKDSKILYTRKIKSIHYDTFVKVYKRVNNMISYWGGCGGSILKLPYGGQYILLTLEDDEDYIIITGHQLNKLIYSETIVNDIIIDKGIIFEKSPSESTF